MQCSIKVLQHTLKTNEIRNKISPLLNFEYIYAGLNLLQA